MRYALLALLLLTGLPIVVQAEESSKTQANPPSAQTAEKVVVDRDIEYAKAGDVSLKLDIVHPEGNPVADAKLRPIIVFIHGGGWRGGNKRDGIGVVQPFVTSGEYIAFSVAYRFSDVATWPAQIHDCKAAIRWIRAHAKEYGGDPDKIGVIGVSAGGHLVSMLGTSGNEASLEGDLGTKDVSSRVQCVVDICGPTDFPAFESKAVPLIDSLLGGKIKEKHDIATNASPITFVSKDDPPFLILHGSKDDIVPYDQAERFDKALRAENVDVTLVKIDGGGHGIGGPKLANRVVDFFAKHLQGKDVVVSGEAIQP